MITIDLVGYLAGFTVAVALIPQVIKSWKTKSTKDISITWTSIYIVGLTLWIIYGYGIASYPILVAAGIELILAMLILILKLKYS